MFHKILWKSHPPQGICCSERMLKHFSQVRLKGHLDSSKDNLGMSVFSIKVKKLSLKIRGKKARLFCC